MNLQYGPYLIYTISCPKVKVSLSQLILYKYIIEINNLSPIKKKGSKIYLKLDRKPIETLSKSMLKFKRFVANSTF